jgi:CheY-like chemotaxis protein
MSGTPVVLMSGVVNKQVAEKAFAVKADELIRKPFQPGDLIGRVKQLLGKGGHGNATAPVVPISQPVPQPQVVPQVQVQAPAATLSSIFAAATRPGASAGNGGNGHAAPMRFGNAAAPQAPASAATGVSNAPVASRVATGGPDMAKLRIELLRLEHLVKKLQSELDAERQYVSALEEHIKTLQETE